MLDMVIAFAFDTSKMKVVEWKYNHCTLEKQLLKPDFISRKIASMNYWSKPLKMFCGDLGQNGAPRRPQVGVKDFGNSKNWGPEVCGNAKQWCPIVRSIMHICSIILDHTLTLFLTCTWARVWANIYKPKSGSKCFWANVFKLMSVS